MCKSVSSFDDKNARKMAHHHLIDVKEGRYFLCFLAETNHITKYEEITLLGFHANCRKKTFTLQWCSAKFSLLSSSSTCKKTMRKCGILWKLWILNVQRLLEVYYWDHQHLVEFQVSLPRFSLRVHEWCSTHLQI